MADNEITVTRLDRKISTVDGKVSVVVTFTAAAATWQITFTDVMLKGLAELLQQIHDMGTLEPGLAALAANETRAELQNRE